MLSVRLYEMAVEPTVIPGPLFENCSTCDGNKDIGYQLKIYSKNHNPTKGEKFDKPILVTQGFDASYHLVGQFNFDKFENILDSVFDENDTSIALPKCQLGTQG